MYVLRPRFLPLLALLLLFLLLPTFARAALPQAASVPGGIALIPLPTVSSDAPRPRAWFGEQRVLVAADRQQWYAVVGLPLDLPAGTHALRVSTGDATENVKFAVSPKHYPEQRIRLKDGSKVQLSTADEARAVRELATIQGLKAYWREADDTDPAFLLPAAGRLAGRFGLRRYFNGEARAPHAGLDLAVPRGTPIKASASGQVLAVDDYFFNGKTIFVDHGNGLITMYCHLERADVLVGDSVAKGQRLGLSGSTGRATGPHLHWSVVLNGAMVDPELFVRAYPQR